MDDLEYYINQFTWWISSDEYLTPDGACFDMENVDIDKSSTCITATKTRNFTINTRSWWRTISVAPFGTEWASYDWIIEWWWHRGDSAYPWSNSRPCLFAMPKLWPKLKSSNNIDIRGFGRNSNITWAIRWNMGNTPFWLVGQYRLFSLIHPDVLYTAVDSDNQMSGIEDFTLGTGWSISWEYAVHSGGTDPLSITISNQYGTYYEHDTSTDSVTNYQMFWFWVSDHNNWSIRVKVGASIAVFKRDNATNQYQYQSTSSNVTESRARIYATNWEDAWFCFAINGLDWDATWTITPTNDFDGKIFCGGVVNVENYLQADRINSNLSMLALDNCYIDNFRDSPMGVDSTDLQSKMVITPWKGGFIVGKGNYIVMLNMKDGFQIWPALDLILPTSYEIMWITISWDQIVIYANSNGSGYQITWDWASQYPDYTYVWEWQTFETVISSMDYDYVTVRAHGDTMQYYVVSWPKRNLIWSSDYFSDEIDWYNSIIQKENSRMLTQRDDKEVRWALWIMRCWQPVFASLWWDMLVYWTKKAWFSNSRYKPLSLWYEITDYWDIVYPLVDCLWASWSSWIWIYYTNIKWEHLCKYIEKWYWSWYTEDHFYQGDCYNKKFSYTLNPIIWSHFAEKELDKLFISYKLPNDFRKINLYAKVDDNTFMRFLPKTTVSITKWAVYTGYNTDCPRIEYIWTDDGWLVFHRIWPFNRDLYMWELYKISGEWDSVINVLAMDDWIRIWELRYNWLDHNYENLINSQVYNKLPFFHKIQFKIECDLVTPIRSAYSVYKPPEIYNIYIPFRQHTVW